MKLKVFKLTFPPGKCWVARGANGTFWHFATWREAIIWCLGGAGA